MRRRNTLLTSAVMACGAFAFSCSVYGADGTTAAPNAPADTTVTGIDVRTSDVANSRDTTVAPDADSIRKSVSAATEDAVTKGDFYKLARRFVDADHARIKEYKSADNFAKLDGRIDQFRKDWKEKYNQDFGYEASSKDVLNENFARITQGEIGEARTASGKEVPSDQPQNVKGGPASDLKASGVAKTDANSNKLFGGDTNKEAGRNIATVTVFADKMTGSIPADAVNADAQKMMKPELAIPMIHQLPDSWKIDVPDSLDGQKLESNLLNNLTKLDEDRANWPADVNEAYRAVTRCVMQSVMDSDTAH